MGSKAYILNSAEKPAYISTGGLGSDFYGYKGNGFLERLIVLTLKILQGKEVINVKLVQFSQPV